MSEITEFINKGLAAQAAVDKLTDPPKPKPLAMTHPQAKRTGFLLEVAEKALRTACEERLNLDVETRRAIEHAVDQVLACWAPFNSQIK